MVKELPMKICVEAFQDGFFATSDQNTTRYFGHSGAEALGEAVRGNIHNIPGLEIEMAPKTVEQMKYEERRREATRAHGN